MFNYVTFVTSIVYYWLFTDAGVSCKSVEIAFPDDEYYDGIELFEDALAEDALAEVDGLVETLSMLAIAAETLEHPEQAVQPSMVNWAKCIEYRVNYFNSQHA